MTARILVVDDIEANVRLLEAKLTAEYYDVITAYDGPTALAMAASECPDIVLLDVMMPGMDGFEVCRRLKATPETREIPIIFLTGLESDADEALGLSLGAEDFIHKPVSPSIVLARVKNHLKLSRAT